MTESDPCQGCRHLDIHPRPNRPECARGANYGQPPCRYEPPQKRSGAPVEQHPYTRPRHWRP